jgi:hypothetical protein
MVYYIMRTMTILKRYVILLIQRHILDINECNEETDDCEEHCYNSIGGYYCNCTGPGYRLHGDGNTCESEYQNTLQSNFNNGMLQILMNVLRVLMTVFRSVQTPMGVMSVPVLLAIS